MPCYHSPNPSLSLFKRTWCLSSISSVSLLRDTGPSLNSLWSVLGQGGHSAARRECPSLWKFTLCCSWLAAHSPSPKPACSGLQEWGLPSGCSDPPPCRKFLLAWAAPRRSVNTGRVLMYAGFGQLSCMPMIAFPQPFFCYSSCRWCWDMMAVWVGTIILHRKNSMDVTFLKHLKDKCCQVGRLMAPGTFQSMNSVLKDCKHNWLKPLKIGKFETCFLHYHFHNNLSSSPIRNAPLAFVRVCQNVPFPNPWIGMQESSEGAGRPALLGKWLSWSQLWGRRSWVLHVLAHVSHPKGEWTP